jgi:hypothetical protein
VLAEVDSEGKKKDQRVKDCPSPTRAARNWVQLKTSDAAGEGSTRAKVQGVFFPGATKLE